MTVEEAIKRLREQVAPRLPKRPEIIEAMAMAIEALEIWEKEKEPAPQETVTSSNNNYSIKNDNTRLKICQEFFCKTMRALNNEYQTMSQDERRIWLFGEISIGVSYINKLLEEEKQ